MECVGRQRPALKPALPCPVRAVYGRDARRERSRRLEFIDFSRLNAAVSLRNTVSALCKYVALSQQRFSAALDYFRQEQRGKGRRPVSFKRTTEYQFYRIIEFKRDSCVQFCFESCVARSMQGVYSEYSSSTNSLRSFWCMIVSRGLPAVFLLHADESRHRSKSGVAPSIPYKLAM